MSPSRLGYERKNDQGKCTAVEKVVRTFDLLKRYIFAMPLWPLNNVSIITQRIF